MLVFDIIWMAGFCCVYCSRVSGCDWYDMNCRYWCNVRYDMRYDSRWLFLSFCIYTYCVRWSGCGGLPRGRHDLGTWLSPRHIARFSRQDCQGTKHQWSYIEHQEQINIEALAGETWNTSCEFTRFSRQDLLRNELSNVENQSSKYYTCTEYYFEKWFIDCSNVETPTIEN